GRAGMRTQKKRVQNMKIASGAGPLPFGLVRAPAAGSAPPAAAARAPANPVLAAAVESGVSDVGYYRYRHRRHYRYWGGPAYPYYGYSGYPYYRYSAPGFYDQGYAYRGNIPGCSVDLGYGRYESCDKR